MALLLSLLPPSLMVAPERSIANFNFIMSPMSTVHTNEQPNDTAVNIPQGRPLSRASVGGPRSASPSPIDFSPPSEINYAERVLAQNSMDVEFNDMPSLAANAKQQSWADQDNNNCSSIPQDNVPLNQNEVYAHVNGANPLATCKGNWAQDSRRILSQYYS